MKNFPTRSDSVPKMEPAVYRATPGIVPGECSWFADADDQVLYFGQSAFWSAYRERDGDPVAATAGVPAGAVQRSSDLAVDPQLRHRRFHRELLHPEMGRGPYAGHQFRIRGYDSGPRFAAPVLGQHSFEVMSELLGIPDEEVGELMASGIIA